jgi:hypothetical protein
MPSTNKPVTIAGGTDSTGLLATRSYTAFEIDPKAIG